jgi:2-oxoisovalerate dehydrogenase E1 component alpha subunit
MRLKQHLIALGEWSEEQQEAMDREVADQVRAAAKEAEKNGTLGHGLHHPLHTLFEDVFEQLPWHLEEQAEQAIRERRIKWPDWKE